MDGYKVKEKKNIIIELTVKNDDFKFASNIESALDSANSELNSINEIISETEETLSKLTPNCDKLDYILAGSIGILCGIIDIFLVGKPGKSPVGIITDKWFKDRIVDFAKLVGWKDNGEHNVKSAIGFLERNFVVPYDQRGAGDVGRFIFELTPSNHRFKSLAHNPTIVGLFFSILDQFNNSSHFVTNGELISLEKSSEKFELKGNDTPSKFLCGIINWFGHLMSDISGTSSGKGRGKGIPSPIFMWINDIIVIKRKLDIDVSKFDKEFNELVILIYEKGYDVRFQTTQAIPVFVNEILTRIIYSVRRLIKCFSDSTNSDYSIKKIWEKCEPFTNASVKRMLTVSHGVFMIMDLGDATIRTFITTPGIFNFVEFCLRLNIIGMGRIVVSIYGGIDSEFMRNDIKNELYLLKRERIIIVDYIDGLKELSKVYNDKSLLSFISDFENSGLYKEAFENSIELARKRGVHEKYILKNKDEIDEYFMKGNKNEK